MSITALYPALIAVAAGIVYAVVSVGPPRTKVVRISELVFFAAFLAWMLTIASKSTHIA
jgi:hypothetical protein